MNKLKVRLLNYRLITYNNIHTLNLLWLVYLRKLRFIIIAYCMLLIPAEINAQSFNWSTPQVLFPGCAYPYAAGFGTSIAFDSDNIWHMVYEWVDIDAVQHISYMNSMGDNIDLPSSRLE